MALVVDAFDAGVDVGLLIVVDPAGWDPFRQALSVDAAGPAFLQEMGVVVSAEQGQIVKIGRAAEDPVEDVVSVGLARFSRTPSQWSRDHRKGVLMASYSQEFKDQVVGLHRQGRTFMDFAKEFNLSATSIANWVRAADRRTDRRPQAQDRESDAMKIRRLGKELARKEEELEILGKALAFFARRVDQ